MMMIMMMVILYDDDDGAGDERGQQSNVGKHSKSDLCALCIIDCIFLHSDPYLHSLPVQMSYSNMMGILLETLPILSFSNVKMLLQITITVISIIWEITIEAVAYKSFSQTSVVGFEALRDPDDQLEASQEVGILGMEGMVTLILAYN